MLHEEEHEEKDDNLQGDAGSERDVADAVGDGVMDAEVNTLEPSQNAYGHAFAQRHEEIGDDRANDAGYDGGAARIRRGFQQVNEYADRGDRIGGRVYYRTANRVAVFVIFVKLGVAVGDEIEHEMRSYAQRKSQLRGGDVLADKDAHYDVGGHEHSYSGYQFIASISRKKSRKQKIVVYWLRSS